MAKALDKVSLFTDQRDNLQPSSQELGRDNIGIEYDIAGTDGESQYVPDAVDYHLTESSFENRGGEMWYDLDIGNRIVEVYFDTGFDPTHDHFIALKLPYSGNKQPEIYTRLVLHLNTSQVPIDCGYLVLSYVNERGDSVRTDGLYAECRGSNNQGDLMLDIYAKTVGPVADKKTICRVTPLTTIEITTEDGD